MAETTEEAEFSLYGVKKGINVFVEQRSPVRVVRLDTYTRHGFIEFILN